MRRCKTRYFRVKTPHRKADYSIIIPAYVRNKKGTQVILYAISARLIHRRAARNIALNFRIAKRSEGHLGCFRKKPHTLKPALRRFAARTNQADGTDHRMRVSAQAAQHLTRMTRILGLTQNLIVEHHNRISADDQRVGVLSRNIGGFKLRQPFGISRGGSLLIIRLLNR